MDLRRILALALLHALAATAPLAAQRGPDLDAVVRDMLARKTDVGTAARTLLATHRQTPDAAVALLVRNGYRATEVAQTSVTVMRMDARAASRALGSAGARAVDAGSGLQRGGVAKSAVVEALGGARFPIRDVTSVALRDLALAPIEAVAALKAGGYGAQEVTTALDGEGVLVDLGCIDRQGYPAPCGDPGGAAAPAMGDVSVTPATQGWTDSILTIQGTNIPEVQIRLAGQTLETVDASDVRVRVRLPPVAVTGALVMRRVSDGVEGPLVPSFAVVAPPPEPGPGLAWIDVGTEAARGAAEDATLWLVGAELVEAHCEVAGALLLGSPGVLHGSVAMVGRVKTRLLELGATPAVADAFDRTFREAWADWADHVMIPGVPAFPALAAWPAAEAPPVPGAPVPMTVVVSSEASRLTSAALGANVLARLGDAADAPSAQEGVAAFANVVGTRFAVWIATAQLLSYTGWGPVPAVPAGAPAGPVVDGRCKGKGVLAHTHF